MPMIFKGFFLFIGFKSVREGALSIFVFLKKTCNFAKVC